MLSSDANPEIDSGQITGLRAAIQANRVTFPTPVPVFPKEYRADVQWRMVELYFVHGWSPARLAERYRISGSRVRQSLRGWVHRAKAVGYLQPLPPLEDLRSALFLSAPPNAVPEQSFRPFAHLADALTPASQPPPRHA